MKRKKRLTDDSRILTPYAHAPPSAYSEEFNEQIMKEAEEDAE